jgi:IS30 family transposase
LNRGNETADHKRFIVAANVLVYFCDPHSLWQRGTRENTNGLLGPSGTELQRFSQAHLSSIARRLNL